MVSSPGTGDVYAVSVVFVLVSIAALALRFYARHLLRRGKDASVWKADDWLLFATTLLLWGMAIILIYGASVGTIGTHTQEDPVTGAVIPTWHENQMSMFGFISQLLTILALGTLKSGVVMLYRHVFRRPFFQKFAIGMVVLLATWTLAFFLATILECKGGNPNLGWVSIVTFKSQCQNYKTIQLGQCVSDVITDLMVLALPLYEISRLHLETRQKIAVSLIFLVGLLSVAAGTARLVIVAEDIVETTAGARDVRGVETSVLVWTYVEVGVGIVAACLPTLRPLVRRQTVDSIVANGRSRASVHSLDSSKDRGEVGSSRGNGDMELAQYPFSH